METEQSLRPTIMKLLASQEKLRAGITDSMSHGNRDIVQLIDSAKSDN